MSHRPIPSHTGLCVHRVAGIKGSGRHGEGSDAAADIYTKAGLWRAGEPQRRRHHCVIGLVMSPLSVAIASK